VAEHLTRCEALLGVASKHLAHKVLGCLTDLGPGVGAQVERGGQDVAKDLLGGVAVERGPACGGGGSIRLAAHTHTQGGQPVAVKAASALPHTHTRGAASGSKSSISLATHTQGGQPVAVKAASV
jgi:hypothetical protein